MITCGQDQIHLGKRIRLHKFVATSRQLFAQPVTGGTAVRTFLAVPPRRRVDPEEVPGVGERGGLAAVFTGHPQREPLVPVHGDATEGDPGDGHQSATCTSGLEFGDSVSLPGRPSRSRLFKPPFPGLSL